MIEQLTDYIAHDKAAMDFVDGKADPWGMKVNPSYKKIKLPRAEWPLLDTTSRRPRTTCRQNNPAVYFTQLAAPGDHPAQDRGGAADAWPNVQTRCDVDLATGGYKLGRIDRQSFGSRFMLGIVSLGDANATACRSAALETKSGRRRRIVARERPRSVAARRADASRQTTGRPFVLDQADVRKSRKAYPGTMVVYTAAKTADLPAEDATTRSRSSSGSATTEGQRAGTGNGELPAGFLPDREDRRRRRSGSTSRAEAPPDAIEAPEPPPTRVARRRSPSDRAADAVPAPAVPIAAPTGRRPGGGAMPTDGRGRPGS